ncbi:hypothetical protein AB4865_00220 [Capnocytophaga sp. ARDL2]|uniref:hypothetical protein n=1 Tax=Capnocytophaga sp. ARDL2 TaxID=3238809 RepID=UPI0035561FF2
MESFINDFKKFKVQLSEESCVKKQLFIKLGEGNAPALDYNLPQSASFTSYGNQFVKEISQKFFFRILKKFQKQLFQCCKKQF